jgi:gluconolactonase
MKNKHIAPLHFAARLTAGLLVAITSLNCQATKGSHHKNLVPAGGDSSIIAPGAKPVLVSRQFSFTEGPSVDKQGNIFFTDQPNNKIWEYTADSKLQVFMDSAGRSNGTYFDKEGDLITCADEHDQLWKISPQGKVTVLVTNYHGYLLNGPNDLWIAPDGGIYLTDPYFQRSYWQRKSPDPGIQGNKLYYLPAGKTELQMADTSVIKPNGIVGTPDGKYLYVADMGNWKTYRYVINTDGTLTDKQLFVNEASDGMTIDERGDIYLTNNGVSVYSPQGVKIEHIDIPEKWTANICFGGKDRKMLFITASEAIYTLQMQVKGVE